MGALPELADWAGCTGSACLTRWVGGIRSPPDGLDGSASERLPATKAANPWLSIALPNNYSFVVVLSQLLEQKFNLHGRARRHTQGWESPRADWRNFPPVAAFVRGGAGGGVKVDNLHCILALSSAWKHLVLLRHRTCQ